MKNITVATVQYNCSIPDQNLNTEIGIRFVKKAKELGADIVLFPECWITAYAFPDIVETNLPSDEIENHPDFTVKYIHVILVLNECSRVERNLKCAILAA